MKNKIQFYLFRKRFWNLVPLLAILALTLLAQPGFASVTIQNTRVKIAEKNISLADLIWKIDSQTEYEFVYTSEELEGYHFSSINEEGELNDILDEIFEGKNLSYSLQEGVYIIKKVVPKPIKKEQTQKKNVKGKVTDDQGIPLPGVSVVIKGTNVGVATNIDGEYSLEFEQENVVLVYSFVGMMPQEVKYSGQKVINVSLGADTEALSEVVITGYTKTSKVRQSSSSTKITSESVERQVTVNLDDRMEGLATGLNINSVTKSGGQETKELILRGISTFDEEDEFDDPARAARNSLNRQPLIVVDGFPYEGPFNDIDQSTIETIDVLKDAAATALWGLRASNGVIVITTKRGKEGKAKVTFSTNWTFGTKMDLNDFGLASSADEIEIRNRYEQFNQNYSTAYNAINYVKEKPAWWDFYYPGVPFVAEPNWGSKYDGMDAFDMIWADYYASGMSEQDAADRDAKLALLGENDVLSQFEDKLLRAGFAMQNSVSISGGSPLINYNFTASHSQEKKPDLGDDYERLNMSLTTDIKVSERLKMIVDASLTTSEKQDNGIGVASLYTGNVIRRYYNLVDDAGNPAAINDVYGPYKDEFLSKGFDPISYSPILDQKVRDNKQNNFNLRLAVGLNYKINSWLSADLKYQYNGVRRIVRNHKPVELYEMRIQQNRFVEEIDKGDGAGVKYVDAYPYGGWLERNETFTTYKVLRGTLNFNKVFAEHHVVSGIVGMETTENEYSINQQKFIGYNDKTGLYNGDFNHSIWKDNYDYTDKPYLGYAFMFNDNLYTPETKSRTISSFSNFGYSYKAKYNIEASAKVDQATAFGINKRLAKNLYWALSGSWNIHKEDFVNANWLDALKLRASYGVNGNMRRGLTTETTIQYAASDRVSGNPYARVASAGNPNLSPEETRTTNLGLDFGLFNRIKASVDVYSKQSRDLLVNQKQSSTYAIGDIYSNDGAISNKGIELNLDFHVIKGNDFNWNTNINLSYNKNKVLVYGNRPEVAANSYYSDVSYGSTKVIGKDVSVKARYRWAGLDDNGDPQVYNKAGDIIGYADPRFNELSQDDMLVTKPFIAPAFGGITNRITYKNFTLSALVTYKFGHVFQESLKAKFPVIRGSSGTQVHHKDVANAWTPENTNTNIPAMARSASESSSIYRERAFLFSNYAMHDAAHVRLKDITLNYQLGKGALKKLGISSASFMFQVRDLGLLWTANKEGIDPESIPFSGNNASAAGNFAQAYRPGIKVPVSFVIGGRFTF